MKMEHQEFIGKLRLRLNLGSFSIILVKVELKLALMKKKFHFEQEQSVINVCYQNHSCRGGSLSLEIHLVLIYF